MPSIYLSPSIQEYNPYIIGGSEEYYMNLIVDAMVPYLQASEISFTRNNPGTALSQIIKQSNAGNYDLHLALHSNSSPDNMRGVLQGPDVFFYTTSAKGKRAADIAAANMKKIYPQPDLVTVIPTTTLAELRKTRSPAILAEIAYHDNYADAVWIRDNIPLIALSLARSVAEYLEVPLVD